MDRSKFSYKGPAPDDDSQGRKYPHTRVTSENVSPSSGCSEHQCGGQNIQEHLHKVSINGIYPFTSSSLLLLGVEIYTYPGFRLKLELNNFMFLSLLQSCNC